MDNPLNEIRDAINLCAGASSPDVQVASIIHYFTPSASFIYPVVRISPSAASRKKIIRIYLFYRAAIPETCFEIQHAAFDEHEKGRTGHLFVKLVQRPYLRGVSWLCQWRPKVEMHIEFDLVKEKREGEDEEKWRINRQEDLVQPLVRRENMERNAADKYRLYC